ncbi:MAG: DUF262 domain-containing protein [Ruminococcus sp.]|nr:DUF262 domain-containing protein [Ruminococcus sp.]
MFIFQGSIITNFLSQNGQQYKIPVYQRNYEWSKEQCKKLFEDIVQAAGRNQLHFCGSIVFQPLAPIKGINNSIIIDGQQRLTTIYILIKALYDMAANDAEKVAPEQALFNKDQFGQYTIDDTSKMKLKPAKDNNDQLLSLIHGKFDKLDKSCEIYRNYTYFCEMIKEQQNKGMTVSDIYRGISLLTVAVIQLDGNDKAQEIFERINSTGIPLSLADKIRNYVLMTDINQDYLYEEYWIKVERMLPKEQLSAFFLDYLNIKIDGFAKETDAYDVFKSVYSDGKFTNESMLKEILHYAEFYHTFLYGNKAYGENVDCLLKNLQKLKQTTVFLFLFRVFDDHKAGIIDNKELENILRFLLNYSIRRLICEVGSNSLRGLYKTLYSRVFARPENKNHYYDAIVSFFQQSTSKDALPTEEAFTLALEQNNLYRKNALCKFLLAAIENQGKEKLQTDNLTIEHIMPQNKNLSTAWQKMLGENEWQNVQDKYLHTLGNLMLTGYNSELGDKPFDVKKKELEEAETKIVILYSDVRECEKWNADTIEKRAERLSGIVKQLFPIEQPVTRISFADPRYQEYTCDDPDTATYKTPNYYILQGERVNATNFAELLRSLISRLYEMDDSIIKEMAKNNECLIPWSQNILFSYDNELVYGDLKLGDTDIYMGSGFSASYIMHIIRALLDKYDIDRSEFVYSARSSKKTDKQE